MRKSDKHQNGKKIAWLSVFFAVAVLSYIMVYCCFWGDGFLTPGKELEKRDWLGFFGAYLSFIGTVAVSLIAILQKNKTAMWGIMLFLKTERCIHISPI